MQQSAETIYTLISDSRYAEILSLHVSDILVVMGSNKLKVSFSDDGRVELEVAEGSLDIPIVVTQDESDEKLSFQIEVPSGDRLSLVVSKMLYSVFNPGEISLNAKDELVTIIYPYLFCGVEHEEVGHIADSNVEVLRFNSAVDGYDAYVTSGVSNPNTYNTELKGTDGRELSGLGIEYLYFAKRSEEFAADKVMEVLDFYLSQGKELERKNHIKVRVDQDIAGLLIRRPINYPSHVLIQTGEVFLNVIIGLHENELDHMLSFGDTEKELIQFDEYYEELFDQIPKDYR